MARSYVNLFFLHNHNQNLWSDKLMNAIGFRSMNLSRKRKLYLKILGTASFQSTLTIAKRAFNIYLQTVFSQFYYRQRYNYYPLINILSNAPNHSPAHLTTSHFLITFFDLYFPIPAIPYPISPNPGLTAFHSVLNITSSTFQSASKQQHAFDSQFLSSRRANCIQLKQHR